MFCRKTCKRTTIYINKIRTPMLIYGFGKSQILWFPSRKFKSRYQIFIALKWLCCLNLITDRTLDSNPCLAWHLCAHPAPPHRTWPQPPPGASIAIIKCSKIFIKNIYCLSCQWIPFLQNVFVVPVSVYGNIISGDRVEMYITSNNDVHFSVCFYSRHIPLMMELSNQYHTMLLPLLRAGSTLYLYFPSI